MDNYAELARLLKVAQGNPHLTILQGIVTSVDGEECEVSIGAIDVPCKLRASDESADNTYIVVPEIGSAVILGSLSGDLSNLIVLAIDKVKSIKVSGTMTINGGGNGGMVNISKLTDSINKLVNTFNNHTHAVTGHSLATPTSTKASNFSSSDYEDKKITH